MLMSCISSKVDWIKCNSNFHLQHIKYWKDFQALHNKTRNIWIGIPLFRTVFKFANAVTTMDIFFARHQDTHVALYSCFEISYEAVLKLQLPTKSLKPGAWVLPRKVSSKFITFSWCPHSPTSVHVARIFLWQPHHTSPNTVWSCQTASWLQKWG